MIGLETWDRGYHCVPLRATAAVVVVVVVVVYCG
jgi:hypothetical protein